MDMWLWLYLGLAGLAVTQSVLVTVQIWEHRRFARRRLGRVDTYGTPGPVLLTIPCRGVDVGLEGNLDALLGQDYGDLRVRFVVESADDPVCAMIRRVIERHPGVDCDLLVAGKAEHSGQKVHNLRAATAQVPADIRYLAFVDSDARLQPHWLRAMVARLDQPGMAVTTGYRWFLPSRPSPASLLLHSVNTNYCVMFGPKTPSFVWGGSWAIRRDLFESLRIREAWEGTLSDDLVASRVIRLTRLRAAFEPACMVLSPLDVSWASMFSFLRRQYVIGRYYATAWWACALTIVCFASLFLWGSLGLAAWGVATGWAKWWIPAGIAATLYFLSVVRGFLRRAIAGRYFPDMIRRLHPVLVFDIWATPLASGLHAAALISSIAGRHITWRGIRYRLFRKGKIELVQRDDSYSEARNGQQRSRPAPTADSVPNPHFLLQPREDRGGVGDATPVAQDGNA